MDWLCTAVETFDAVSPVSFGAHHSVGFGGVFVTRRKRQISNALFHGAPMKPSGAWNILTMPQIALLYEIMHNR